MTSQLIHLCDWERESQQMLSKVEISPYIRYGTINTSDYKMYNIDHQELADLYNMDFTDGLSDISLSNQ
jgi:hypothetical protein